MWYNTAMILPADNFILLSLINTKLRDNYSSLQELCEEEGVTQSEIINRLAALGYAYDEEENGFKRI